MILKLHLWGFKIIKKLHSCLSLRVGSPRPLGRIARAAEASSPANKAGFGSTAVTVRPRRRRRGQGAGAVTPEVLRATRRAWLAAEPHMPERQQASSHASAEKSDRGAGGAGASRRRPRRQRCCGRRSQHRWEPADVRAKVMWSEQLGRVT